MSGNLVALILTAGAAWGFVRLITDMGRAVSRWLNEGPRR